MVTSGFATILTIITVTNFAILLAQTGRKKQTVINLLGTVSCSLKLNFSRTVFISKCLQRTDE